MRLKEPEESRWSFRAGPGLRSIEQALFQSPKAGHKQQKSEAAESSEDIDFHRAPRGLRSAALRISCSMQASG